VRVNGREFDVLREQLQGKSSAEVLNFVIKLFGPPDRNIGFGLSIPQWDVNDGWLTCHPHLGPSYTEDGVRTWLLRTANPVGDSVFGQYGMATLPDPNNHGNCCSIGSVHLSSDNRYWFTDHFQHSPRGLGQEENIFLHNPTGAASVEFAPGVIAQTLLESLPEGSLVATVVVWADEQPSSRMYSIISDLSTRQLHFESDPPIPFQLRKGWGRYWGE
jgi:hypothetical protein